MKRFSKLLALGLAAVMTFGMTVSAAGSPSPGEIAAAEKAAREEIGKVEVPKDATVYVGDKPSKVRPSVYSVTGETYLQITSYAKSEGAVKAVKDAAKAKLGEGYALSGEPEYVASVEVWIGYANGEDYNTDEEMEAWGMATIEDLKAGVRVPLKIDNYDENAQYVFLHRNAAGVWETITGEPNGGVVYLTLHSFSPVVIMKQGYTKVTPTGEGSGNGGSNTNTSNNNSGAPVSPKTGEAVPVAAILTFVCLAGAAVCVKKVRYNR